MPSGELTNTHQRTRRFSPRARVSWTVWAHHGQQRMRFHTVDVSPRGAKLRPKGPFRVGTALQLEFITPEGGRSTCRGWSGAPMRTGWPSCSSARSRKAWTPSGLGPDRRPRRADHALADAALVSVRWTGSGGSRR
jgi:hypothetical protein